MTERALSFGAVAEQYERHRPGYPDELVDAVLAYAGPVSTALEIGAGTGKATRAFAARGIDVTATDPDAEMLHELSKHVAARTLQSTFEDLPPQTYDLVFAAASFHWTRPEGRMERLAGHLVAGGTFANFGGQLDIADPEVAEAVRKAKEPDLQDDGIPSQEDQIRWPGSELEASGLFSDVRQLSLPHTVTMSAEDYIGHLGTISAYVVLEPHTRGQVFHRVRAALPPTVSLNRELHAHLARRA